MAKLITLAAIVALLAGFTWLSNDAFEACLNKGYSVQECDKLNR